jgi:hypothetical protein
MSRQVQTLYRIMNFSKLRKKKVLKHWDQEFLFQKILDQGWQLILVDSGQPSGNGLGRIRAHPQLESSFRAQWHWQSRPGAYPSGAPAPLRDDPANVGLMNEVAWLGKFFVKLSAFFCHNYTLLLALVTLGDTNIYPCGFCHSKWLR